MDSATGACPPSTSSQVEAGSESTAAARAKLSDPTPAALLVSSPSSQAFSEQQASSKDEEQEQEDTFDPLAYEQQNVHAVYNAIAPHFSITRYKPWPLIPAFLDTFDAGSVGADLGAGNGKYLLCGSVLHGQDEDESKGNDKGKGKERILTIGSDRSDQLIELAYNNAGNAAPSSSSIETSARSLVRNEVTVADALTSNFCSQRCDYAISIAAIHHFSTRKRRVEAVQEMIRLLRPRPRFAFHGHERGVEKGEARGRQDEAGATQEENQAGQAIQYGSGSGRFMIYAWAMEQRGEGRRAGKFDTESTSTDAAEEKPQDVLVPWVLSQGAKKKERDKGRSEHEGSETPPVYQRYYHLFKQGELEELVQDAANSFSSSIYAQGCVLKDVRVVRQSSGWEKGNWWGIWAVHQA